MDCKEGKVYVKSPFWKANNLIFYIFLQEWKPIKKPKGPGLYTVVKCGASGHNIRSNPNLMAPPIGMLALSDQVSVIRTKEVRNLQKMYKLIS